MTRRKLLVHPLILCAFVGYWISVDRVCAPTPLEIVNYGPRQASAGAAFNSQGNQAALWVSTKGTLGKNTKVFWGDTELSTTVSLSKNLVTATVPERLYQKPGSYLIYLLNEDEILQSNKVPVVIGE